MMETKYFGDLSPFLFILNHRFVYTEFCTCVLHPVLGRVTVNLVVKVLLPSLHCFGFFSPLFLVQSVWLFDIVPTSPQLLCGGA